MTGIMLLELLEEVLSGERALAYTTEITRFHRAKGSSDYQEAVGFIKDKLTEWDLAKIVVEKYPADGLTTYQTWTPPPAWEPVRADLSLVHPEARHICSFETEPMCLVFGSTSTPSQGLVLDVVDIGDGTGDQAYAGKEVYGKAVLTSGSSRSVFQKAVKKRGAVGILTDHMARQNPAIKRTPCDLPDAALHRHRLLLASFLLGGRKVITNALRTRQHCVNHWILACPLRPGTIPEAFENNVDKFRQCLFA